MFKDARALDQSRTASAFNESYRRYAAQGEKWFDGSVGSIDRRLAACDRLIHSANSTVARMSVTESQRYLRAAEALAGDRESLVGLKEALLTGASAYQDPGPPGYTAAKPGTGTSAGSNEFTHPAPRTKHPRWMDEGEDIIKTPKPKLTTLAALHQADAGYENRMPNPPSNMNESLKPIYQNAIDNGEDPFEAIKPHLGKVGHWFKDDGSYIVPDDGGPHPSMYSSPHEYLQARNMHDWINRSQQMAPGGGDVAVDESWRSPHDPGPVAGPKPLKNPTGHNPYRAGALDGADRRWVTLESAKFVAANRDALDDSTELAIRAHNHAALKTSTFTGQRSAAVCAAFVEEVVDLGRKTYRPPAPRTAAIDVEFDPQAIYLC